MPNLYDEILREFSLNLDRPDTKMLYVGITRYLLNIEDFNKLRALCKRLSISSETIKAIKFKVFNDHRIAASLKFTMIYCRARQIYHGNIDVKTLFSINNLSKDDVKLFEMLGSDDLKLLDRKIRAIPGNEVYPAKYWRNKCNEVIGDLEFRVKLEKFARARLKFVANSNNWTIDDMVADLNCKAVETFWRVAPYRNDLYLKNTALSAVYNHGIKMIKKYTTKKRGRLIRDEDGSFYNVIRTYEIAGENGKSYGISDAILNRVADVSMYAGIDRKISIQKLKEENPNAKQLIEIITQDYHKPFEKFCQETFKKGADQLLGNNGKAYVAALASYCNMPYHGVISYITTTYRRLNNDHGIGKLSAN